jgi:hypothetical protein
MVASWGATILLFCFFVSLLGTVFCFDCWLTNLQVCIFVLQVRVELSDEQRELYKAILGKNYDSLVGESLPFALSKLSTSRTSFRVNAAATTGACSSNRARIAATLVPSGSGKRHLPTVSCCRCVLEQPRTGLAPLCACGTS